MGINWSFILTHALGLFTGLWFLPSLVFAFQCAPSHGPCAGAQGSNAEWGTYARVGGQNYIVKIPLGPGEASTQWSGLSPITGMPDRCVCGAGHKTSCGRGFCHYHNTFQIPPAGRNARFYKRVSGGLEEAGEGLVTAQMIEAFWDWEYTQDGFTRIAGSQFDPSVNCHGYSMGLATAVNSIDFAPIIQPDDWIGGTYNLRDGTLRTATTADHSAKVEYVNLMSGMGYTPVCVKVSEKFIDSPLYEKVSPNGIASVSPKQQLHVLPLDIGWGTDHARRGIANVPPPPPSGGDSPGMP